MLFIPKLDKFYLGKNNINYTYFLCYIDFIQSINLQKKPGLKIVTMVDYSYNLFL